MKFEVKEHRKNIPAQELIKDLIAVAEKLGSKKISFTTYLKHGKFNSSTLKTRFGSWLGALEKAGLEPVQLPRLNEKILLKNLEEVWIKLGRQPTATEMTAPLSKHGNCSYYRYFGSWNKALKIFEQYKRAQLQTGTCPEEEAKVTENEAVVENEERNTSPRSATRHLRFSVFLRDGFRCTYCGQGPVTHQGVELHCDHIIAWSKGGKTVMDNLQTLCSVCNTRKGNSELITDN